MIGRRLLLALWLLPAMLPAGAAAPLSGKLVSTGSDTLGALTAMWAQSLMRREPRVNVQVRAIGSSAAPTALVQGTADIGPMSRPMTRGERGKFRSRFGYEPTAVPVALDTLAVFVHRDNPLRALTRRQLDGLFSVTRRCGASRPLQRWSELGVVGDTAQRRASRYGRSAASGTYGFFRRRVLCNGDFAAEVNRLVGSAAVVSAVARDRDGIGYASAGFVHDGVRRLQVRDAVGGQLPLSRELLLYLNLPPGSPLPPLIAAFVATALDERGQDSVRSAGYEPLPAARRVALRRRLGLPAR